MRLRAGWAALLIACGSRYAEEQLPAESADAGVADVPATEAGAATSSDGGAPCEAPTTLVIPIASDALITGGAPDQQRPDIAVCFMGLGACLFRFDLAGDAFDAITTGKVFAMSLQISRAISNEECGNDGDCLPFRDDGTLTALPLRADWDKATVTWINRSKTTSSKWSLPGALGNDVGPVAGTVDVKKTDETASVPLDVSQWSDSFLADKRLAVRTTFSDGKRFVAVLASTKLVAPKKPAVLKLSYCPSN